MSARRDRRACLRRCAVRGAAGAVAPIGKRGRHRGNVRVEVPRRCAERRSAHVHQDSEKVLVGRRCSRDRIFRLPGACDRVRSRTRVSGRDCGDDAGVHRAVDGNRQLILKACDPAPKAHVDDVHAVLHCVLDRLSDVVRRSAPCLTREHVVVAEKRFGCDAGQAADGRPRAVWRRRRRVHAGDRPRDVRPVILKRLRSEESRRASEIHTRHDHFLAGERLVAAIEFGEAGWWTQGGVGEKRVRLIDARVNDSDLDAGAGVRDAADGRPGGRRVDEIERAVHHRGVEKARLDDGHARTGAQRVERGAVEAHRQAVQHGVVLAQHLCGRAG